jgi:hypothetical protein
MGEQLQIRYVLRKCNERAPAHTPIAISDTIILRFHIAILKIRETMRIIDYGELGSKG